MEVYGRGTQASRRHFNHVTLSSPLAAPRRSARRPPRPALPRLAPPGYLVLSHEARRTAFPTNPLHCPLPFPSPPRHPSPTLRVPPPPPPPSPTRRRNSAPQQHQQTTRRPRATPFPPCPDASRECLRQSNSHGGTLKQSHWPPRPPRHPPPPKPRSTSSPPPTCPQLAPAASVHPRGKDRNNQTQHKKTFPRGIGWWA